MAEVPLWWAALTALWLVIAGTVDPGRWRRPTGPRPDRRPG
ncbi:hypothetical protein [Streptomyces massasporeus]